MDGVRNTGLVTSQDLSGGASPRRAPAGAVPAPPVVRDEDIASVRDASFPIALRGYDRDAVDDYVREVNRIIAELEVGRSPRSAIRFALDQVSDETRGILERAHETADEITARSRSQADDRLQWAEREARDAIAAATQRVQDLDADAEKVWQERHRLIEDIVQVAEQLTALAEDAEVRFPAEPEKETTPLPELPGPPPRRKAGAVDSAAKPVSADAVRKSVRAASSEPPPPPPPPPPADGGSDPESPTVPPAGTSGA
jgi:DivIVA domain-containing protein